MSKKKHKIDDKRIDNRIKCREYEEIVLSDAMCAKMMQEPKWKTIEREKIKRYNMCMCCTNPATRLYPFDEKLSTLEGLKPHRTVTLCDECYDSVDGLRRSVAFERLMVANEKIGRSFRRYHDEAEKRYRLFLVEDGRERHKKTFHQKRRS